MGIKAHRERLVHTLKRYPFLGVDRNGDETYGPEETYPCRIEGFTRWVRDTSGKEVQAKRRIFVDTGQGTSAVLFDPQDRISLPSEFWPAADKQPAILDVKVRVGRTGVDHIEVIL